MSLLPVSPSATRVLVNAMQPKVLPSKVSFGDIIYGEIPYDDDDNYVSKPKFSYPPVVADAQKVTMLERSIEEALQKSDIVVIGRNQKDADNLLPTRTGNYVFVETDQTNEYLKLSRVDGIIRFSNLTKDTGGGFFSYIKSGQPFKTDDVTFTITDPQLKKISVVAENTEPQMKKQVGQLERTLTKELFEHDSVILSRDGKKAQAIKEKEFPFAAIVENPLSKETISIKSETTYSYVKNETSDMVIDGNRLVKKGTRAVVRNGESVQLPSFCFTLDNGIKDPAMVEKKVTDPVIINQFENKLAHALLSLKEGEVLVVTDDFMEFESALTKSHKTQDFFKGLDDLKFLHEDRFKTNFVIQRRTIDSLNKDTFVLYTATEPMNVSTRFLVKGENTIVADGSTIQLSDIAFTLKTKPSDQAMSPTSSVLLSVNDLGIRNLAIDQAFAEKTIEGLYTGETLYSSLDAQTLTTLETYVGYKAKVFEAEAMAHNAYTDESFLEKTTENLVEGLLKHQTVAKELATYKKELLKQKASLKPIELNPTMAKQLLARMDSQDVLIANLPPKVIVGLKEYADFSYKAIKAEQAALNTFTNPLQADRIVKLAEKEEDYQRYTEKLHTMAKKFEKKWFDFLPFRKNS